MHDSRLWSALTQIVVDGVMGLMFEVGTGTQQFTETEESLYSLWTIGG